VSNPAVCLVSGGLDSCVTAAIASENRNRLAFLHVTYGQITADRELHAFHELADFYEVTKRLVADIGYLEEIGGSALIDRSIPLPAGDPDRTEIPASYVPFRNAHLLAIATSWAEVLGARQIYVGAVEEDSSGYPDCRLDFFRCFDKLIDTGTKPETQLSIVTPLIKMKKSQIVLRGQALGAPLHLTWSCYRNVQRACGQCDSCLLRLRGFEQAGIKDPIAYS